MINEMLEKHIGKFVNIFNEKMSLFGMLRKTNREGEYRVDVPNYSAFYIFKIEDIQNIDLTNTIMIELK